MKRNMIEDLKIWGEQDNRPLFLHGIHGVGKTYLINEFAINFLNSFVYFRTELESEYYSRFLSSDYPVDFVCMHFSLTREEIENETIIFDNTERYPETTSKLIEYAIKNSCKWIFISSYDFINDSYDVFKRKLYPIQFDEFLIALGEEWYVEAIRGHFESHRKLPDIVHTELFSDFEEYIWIGGMPEVVDNYLTSRSSINITGKTEKNKNYTLSLAHHEESFRLKCEQILKCVTPHLFKENQKFMFNAIRTGVTYNMYAEALDTLESEGLILRQNEYASDKKFKLFYPDFSFITASRHDELTDVEYRLRIQNYVLQTLKQKSINTVFWESGNRADLDFIIKTIDKQFPIDFGFSVKNNSKSIASFNKKNDIDYVVRVAENNYFSEDSKYSIPVYALFCFDENIVNEKSEN